MGDEADHIELNLVDEGGCEMEEGNENTRAVNGTVAFVTAIKQLAPNFYSVGIVLEHEKSKSIYHNITAPDKSAIEKSLEGVVPGTAVKLDEFKNGKGYWNVNKIKITGQRTLEKMSMKTEDLSSDLIGLVSGGMDVVEAIQKEWDKRHPGEEVPAGYFDFVLRAVISMWIEKNRNRR